MGVELSLGGTSLMLVWVARRRERRRESWVVGGWSWDMWVMARV